MEKQKPHQTTDLSQSVTEAFIKHETFLKRFLSRFLSRPQDIEDVVQETYLKAFSAEKKQKIHQPKAFLFRVARNAALTELTKKSQQIINYVEDYDGLEIINDEASVEDYAIAPCSYFLFVPHEGVSIAYFTFWYLAFYLALTIFIIPYLAWANEFTATSEEKTLVFSVMAVVGQVSGALFYVLPLLLFFATTEVTPEILKISVFLGIGFLVPGLFLALKVVPNGPAHVPLPTLDAQGQPIAELSLTQKLKGVLSGLVNNKPFVLYVLAFMCLGIGVGMWGGLFFIYVDTYLLLGAEFAELSLWGMAMGAAAIPVWYRLALRWGKRKTWLIGMALYLVVFIGTGLLRPGPDGLHTLFALNMLMTFASGSMGVIAAPMLCDTIDYGRLKDGAERSALYFSIQALMTKVQLAIGGALGFAIVGWFGFDMQATEQTELSLIGLRLSVSWAPTVFVLLAMVFIALMPLNEARMAIIRRKLRARDAGAGDVTCGAEDGA